MAQRISRAKRSIKQAGSTFEMPPEAERDARMGAVLHVLYLIFNEGYTASSGTSLHSAELTDRGDPAGARGPADCCRTTARWRACWR